MIGWDTPVYVYGARVIRVNGFAEFLKICGYGNNGLIYHVLLYVVSFALNQDFAAVERYLSPAIGFLIIIECGLLVKKWFSKTILWVFSILFSTA